MTIETALYPTQLNATLPPQSDIVREGAGHLRLLKTVVKTTFPNLGGAWNATQTEANYIVGVTSPIQAQINSKGAIAGQTWTGAHVFSGTATLPAATTIGAVTAAELAHLSGVTSPIQTQFAAKASLNGATYTGAHNYSAGSITVPTLSPGSTGNGAASVDYANALSFASALPGQAGNAGKFVTTNGTSASWTDVAWSAIAGKPTTLAGYGIVDGVGTTGNQTVAGNKSFTGNVLQTGSGAIGYGTGSGGTVTQITSKATGVTLNKMSGRIVTHDATLSAGAYVAFTFTNSLLQEGDIVITQATGGAVGNEYQAWCSVVQNGAATICLRNNSAGGLAQTVGIDFAIFKRAAS